MFNILLRFINFINSLLPEPDQDLAVASSYNSNSDQTIPAFITTSTSTVEASLLETPMGNVMINHDPVTYHVVENGTKRRKISLVDSVGFTYNVHSKRTYATYWQCTVRPKGNPCKASVIERNGSFQAGKSVHNHNVEAGALTAAKVVVEVKRKALEDKFRPASAIVDEVKELFFNIFEFVVLSNIVSYTKISISHTYNLIKICLLFYT